mmetsp:Transcript_52468/g.114518  ORF Transcript_52468/g.114518 Transcript_52468/m.114518 type:complete len:203 (+) Transcript_52468:298-906(+)
MLQVSKRSLRLQSCSQLDAAHAHRRPLGTLSASRENMRSSAVMFASVASTASASELSQRSAAIGPCSSLFTMPLLSSSTALACFLVSPSPSLPIAFSNSPARIASALLRRALMVGTVSRESRHASNARSSSFSSSSASAAAAARLSLLAATTSLRSSTLYTIALPSSSLQSGATLRGTEMSTRRRMPPTMSGRAGMPSMSAL